MAKTGLRVAICPVRGCNVYIPLAKGRPQPCPLHGVRLIQRCSSCGAAITERPACAKCGALLQ